MEWAAVDASSRTRQAIRTALDAHLAGALDAAESAYRRLLADDADNVDVLHLLAINLIQQGGKTQPAEAYLRRALALRDDPFILATFANLLHKTGRAAEAVTVYQRSLAINPGFAETHNDLGIVFKTLERYADAEAAYRRAIALQPDYATAHNNLGVVLKESGRSEEAAAAYRRALALKPDYAEAHNNLGVIARQEERFADAESAYRRALQLKPDFADARWNLGLLLLAQGRYGEAWPCYESRYHAQRSEGVSRLPKLACPQWQGEPLAGKSLLIWPEQGFGDYIQFVRFVAPIRALGAAHVMLACHPAQKALLETVAGVDAVVTDKAALGRHDYWSFPLSLPACLGSTLATLPATLPYLHALPERVARWRRRLPAGPFSVGLVWKGNPEHRNDALRSLPSLRTLAPLWSVPGVRFVSLQKGAGEEEARQPPPAQPIVDLAADIGDFADSAAIVAQLDLVICVDTALAHLAGALGKTCWLLVQAAEPDWRWGLARRDSPWYPHVLTLFRQTTPGDWDEVVAALAAALRARVAATAIDSGAG